ncbi:MAG TPA: hypothetical protein VH083_09500 [Myxococcales bacterium]|nr:hypothetical protein [Myxococcales bacterium]
MTDHTEFRAIETVPAKRVWPYAVLGAVAVAGLVFVIAHRSASATAAPEPLQATANLAPKIDAPQAAAALQPPRAAEAVKPSEGPNVLGAAIEKTKAVAAVAKGEIDRELARTKTARKETESVRKQNAELQKELQDARAQIAALQQSKKGPPPSDQEQILQMLAPVLRTSSNDGRP